LGAAWAAGTALTRSAAPAATAVMVRDLTG
jgi:hypothetical protein